MSPEARQGLVTAAPRILVREECRERWGKFVCDGRRPISAIIKEFPDFDFSEVGRRPDQPGTCALRPNLEPALCAHCSLHCTDLLHPTGAPPPGTPPA